MDTSPTDRKATELNCLRCNIWLYITGYYLVRSIFFLPKSEIYRIYSFIFFSKVFLKWILRFLLVPLWLNIFNRAKISFKTYWKNSSFSHIYNIYNPQIYLSRFKFKKFNSNFFKLTMNWIEVIFPQIWLIWT